MRQRFTVEIDDDPDLGLEVEQGVTQPMVRSVEVVEGDPDAFFELIEPLARRAPAPAQEAELEPSYTLDAVIGRLRHNGEGFQTLLEFVVRDSDGRSGLWGNGSPWREPMDLPNLEVSVEAEVDQFWSDARTQELDMRADPDPPPVFWYGVDDVSRAALLG